MEEGFLNNSLVLFIENKNDKKISFQEIVQDLNIWKGLNPPIVIVRDLSRSQNRWCFFSFH